MIVNKCSEILLAKSKKLYGNYRDNCTVVQRMLEKYKKLYESKKAKNGNRPVYNFIFGNVLGKKAVFLIQNIFPTTERYIENKYVNSNIDVEIPTRIRDNVIITSIRVVELAERGIDIPFYDIIEMKKILLNK